VVKIAKHPAMELGGDYLEYGVEPPYSEKLFVRSSTNR
jgi:hypothetical protein